jgi:hypothetical protein
MSDISKAVGENSPELIEALKNAASVAEMTEIRRQFLVERCGAERDRFSPTVLTFDNFKSPDAAASGGTFTRTIKIHGVDKVLMADSELALERMVGAAYQAAAAAADGTQPRGSDGKFVSRREMNLAEKTELDLRFRRGEVNAADYLKQSGELETAFSTFVKDKLGIDSEELARNQQTQDAWKTVTEKWLNNHPEWEGGGDGNENLRRITEIIIANGLENSPSVQTLNEVVNFARQNHLLVPPAGTTETAIAKSNSVEEISAASRAALGLPPRNSNLWGR